MSEPSVGKRSSWARDRSMYPAWGISDKCFGNSQPCLFVEGANGPWHLSTGRPRRVAMVLYVPSARHVPVRAQCGRPQSWARRMAAPTRCRRTRWNEFPGQNAQHRRLTAAPHSNSQSWRAITPRRRTARLAADVRSRCCTAVPTPRAENCEYGSTALGCFSEFFLYRFLER